MTLHVFAWEKNQKNNELVWRDLAQSHVSLCLAWKILEAMAQTVVGAALLGAAGTAFLASPGSPGPVSQTAPSLRGTAPGNPGSAGGAGVAGTAALASLAGARWWMVGGSGEVGRMWEVLQHDKLTQH